MDELEGAAQLSQTETERVGTKMILGKAAAASKREGEKRASGIDMRCPMGKEDKRTVMVDEVFGVQRHLQEEGKWWRNKSHYEGA